MQYGVIGEVLKHSYSKSLHGLLGNPHYEICEIPREELEEFFKERSFKAINVTIPYKSTVMPFLDYIDPRAQRIGSVNTVVNRGGKLYGYNTDYDGLLALVQSTEVSLKGKKTLVLGTGGTGKTAKAVATDLGSTVIMVGREEKGKIVCYERAIKEHSDAAFIINTTPVCMFPNMGVLPIEIKSFSNLQGLVDVVYNPLRTDLVQEAQKRGIRAVGGLSMLAWQAIYANSLFFNSPINDQKAKEVVNTFVQGKENIVLVGMPGSGKSTFGKALAQKLGRSFVDTDSIIEESEKRSCRDIIIKDGEKAFRTIEKNVCEKLNSSNGLVIATGGGAVLDDENIRNLKYNGRLFFLDRDLENLVLDPSRPLAPTREELAKLFEKRYDRYRGVSDIVIDANGSTEDVVSRIMEALK